MRFLPGLCLVLLAVQLRLECQALRTGPDRAGAHPDNCRPTGAGDLLRRRRRYSSRP